jgi:hypothetical protein
MNKIALPIELENTFKTILLCLVVGPPLGIFLVAAWGTLQHVTKMMYPNEVNWWGLINFPQEFIMSFLVGCMFAYLMGFFQSITVGAVLSTVAIITRKLSAWAIVLAAMMAIICSATLYWHNLICQCHPNGAGRLFFSPFMFVTSHLILATGCWLASQKIWNKRL